MINIYDKLKSIFQEKYLDGGHFSKSNSYGDPAPSEIQRIIFDRFDKNIEILSSQVKKNFAQDVVDDQNLKTLM